MMARRQAVMGDGLMAHHHGSSPWTAGGSTPLLELYSVLKIK
jgi:hypothetical protein